MSGAFKNAIQKIQNQKIKEEKSQQTSSQLYSDSIESIETHKPQFLDYARENQQNNVKRVINLPRHSLVQEKREALKIERGKDGKLVKILGKSIQQQEVTKSAGGGLTLIQQKPFIQNINIISREVESAESSPERSSEEQNYQSQREEEKIPHSSSLQLELSSTQIDTSSSQNYSIVFIRNLSEKIGRQELLDQLGDKKQYVKGVKLEQNTAELKVEEPAHANALQEKNQFHFTFYDYPFHVLEFLDGKSINGMTLKVSVKMNNQEIKQKTNEQSYQHRGNGSENKMRSDDMDRKPNIFDRIVLQKQVIL